MSHFGLCAHSSAHACPFLDLTRMDTIACGLASAARRAGSKGAKRFDIGRAAIPTWSHNINKPRRNRDSLQPGWT